jgi:hypothetical protein
MELGRWHLAGLKMRKCECLESTIALNTKFVATRIQMMVTRERSE